MIFKNLTFDGISLKEYGVYISGEAVFDSPTREVEMITIPGRNGSFALDKGRFNNITVTYPAGIYATSETEFAEKVSTLRNLLASRKGYCRLTDEYNPDEFRLGVYKTGLELDPTHYNEAGRFELSFDCKPQRFLFSGEEVFTLGEWGQTETKSGSIVSFEGDETTAIKSLTAQIVPKQSGSGDPSPSNVRPISGYSDVNVNVCGVNVWDEEWELGALNGETGLPATNPNYIRSKNFCSIVPNASYYVKAPSTTSNVSVFFYDNTQTFISVIYKFNATFTAPSNARYFKIMPLGSYGTTYNNDISINYPATDVSYHIGANNESYPISLGQTVYGGTLDVVSGVLTITKAVRTIRGTDVASAYSEGTGFWRVNVSATPIPTTVYPEILANKYVGRTSYNAIGNNDNSVGINNATFSQFLLKDTTLTTVDGLKSALNTTPLVICYPLATPTEITLTPTQVTTLLGNNNIWADSGDVTVEIGQNPYILVNPTLFEACPLIEFNSSGEDGEINLGSRQIKVLSAILGRLNLGLDVSGSKTTTRTWQDVITIQNAGSFNAGDTLRFNGGKVIFTFNFTPINVEVVSQGTDLKASWQRGSNNLELSLNNLEFPAGTDTTYSFTCDIKVKASETPSIEGTETFTVTTSYNRNGVLTITWAGGNYSFGEYTYIQGASNYTGYGDSTKNSLEDVDIYVDLDIGEAYSIDSDDNVVSLNNFVNLGGELPTLDPGATEISTDDSISNVKVTPRWWKV